MRNTLIFIVIRSFIISFHHFDKLNVPIYHVVDKSKYLYIIKHKSKSDFFPHSGICLYACLYVSLLVYSKASIKMSFFPIQVSVCMYQWVSVCISECLYISVSVYISVCMYQCLYVSVSVCISECVYVCVCMYQSVCVFFLVFF